jgi:long-chain fatty acid transport protein
MKKVLVLTLAVLVSVPLAFSAIITNTNQSTQYLRLLARNASTDVDAVYYNPAGLTKLADGFHLDVHNEYINQDKTVTNNFPFLALRSPMPASADVSYVGTVRVPLYPNVYLVYKQGPLAFSFGFGPNAGGGSAEFKTGLPSFETPYSVYPLLISVLLGIPTTQYSLDMQFKGE